MASRSPARPKGRSGILSLPAPACEALGTLYGRLCLALTAHHDTILPELHKYTDANGDADVRCLFSSLGVMMSLLASIYSI